MTPKTPSSKLSRAHTWAKRAHANQYRDDGNAFIAHIDGVLDILRNEFSIKDEELLLIATLHDTAEDSNLYSLENIAESFGERVALGVRLLTKQKGQDFGDYMQEIKDCQEIPNLILVKLADRLHNLRTMDDRSKEKILKKCQETREYVLPLAEKFNPKMHREMEELVKRLEIKSV